MKLFHATITETEEHICVAARSADHAAEILVCFWLARTGSAPGDFSIGAGTPPAYVNNGIVRAVAAGNAAGVIVRQLDGSMLFEPSIG